LIAWLFRCLRDTGKASWFLCASLGFIWAGILTEMLSTSLMVLIYLMISPVVFVCLCVMIVFIADCFRAWRLTRSGRG